MKKTTCLLVDPITQSPSDVLWGSCHCVTSCGIMGPGFDQETHQACGPFKSGICWHEKSSAHWVIQVPFYNLLSFLPLFLLPHSTRIHHSLWIMCCLGLMLIPPTQGGQPPLLQLTEPIVLSLSYPALSLQPYTPAGRAGKWLPREPFIRVINALCYY